MKLFNFIQRNGQRLVFLFLLAISMWLTINHNRYDRSEFVNSSNGIFGYFYLNIASLDDYFRLKSENERLFKENIELKEFVLNQIENSNVATSYHNKEIKTIGAKIIKNSYRKKKNILTIKGGTKQGVLQDMGVISDQGIVGIIDHTSNNYATVLSILNTDFQTTAKIKKNNHFGTLTWNGKNTNFVQLIDIPRIASVTKGDTVVTGFNSKAFPKDIPIGIIEKIYSDPNTNHYTFDIKLFTDITTLNHVYVIGNNQREELDELEKKENEQ